MLTRECMSTREYSLTRLEWQLELVEQGLKKGVDHRGMKMSTRVKGGGLTRG